MNDLLVPRWFMVSCLIGHRERNWMTQQAPAGVIFVARGLPRTPIAPGSPSDQLQKQADLSVKVEPALEWVPHFTLFAQICASQTRPSGRHRL
jgi:hypothetical protein